MGPLYHNLIFWFHQNKVTYLIGFQSSIYINPAYFHLLSLLSMRNSSHSNNKIASKFQNSRPIVNYGSKVTELDRTNHHAQQRQKDKRGKNKCQSLRIRKHLRKSYRLASKLEYPIIDNKKTHKIEKESNKKAKKPGAKMARKKSVCIKKKKLPDIVQSSCRNKNLYIKLLSMKKCQVCRQLQDREWDLTILCTTCDDAYHLECLPSPLRAKDVRQMEEWLCPECQEKFQSIDSSENSNQSSFSSISSSQFPQDYTLYPETAISVICGVKNYVQLQDLERHEWTKRQSQVFGLRPFTPLKDGAPFWVSLIRALGSTKHIYCPGQVYKNYQTMNLNRSRNHLPTTAEMLSKKDEMAFEDFEEISLKGHAPPLSVEKCPIKGFLIRAIGSIPSKSILCEYGGEVMIHRKSLQVPDNDSIFNLLQTGRSSTTLDIVPDHFANISKYFLGINNSEVNNYHRINVQSILFSYRGRNRLIFYTRREIAKGELLYIDYNAGILNNYPTHDFK